MNNKTKGNFIVVLLYFIKMTCIWSKDINPGWSPRPKTRIGHTDLGRG